MHRFMTVSALTPPPVPNYDDDAFELIDHSRHVIIECSRQNPVPRIHEGSSPPNWGAPTIVDVPASR